MDQNYSQSDSNGDSMSTLSQLNYNLTIAVLPVTVFIGIECVIGLFGNMFILLVYSRQYNNKSNFRYFVLAMAVTDLISCLTTLPGEIFSQMNWYQYEYDWICKVKSFFNVYTVWASASILFALAYDRYRKICKPLAWQIQPRIAVKLCIIPMAVSSVMAAPALVLWGRQDYLYTDGDIQLNVSICEKSGQYANDIYPLLYMVCVYTVPLGPMMLVIIVLNVFTAKALFCGIKNLRKRLSSNISVSTIQRVSRETCVEFSGNDADVDDNATDITLQNAELDGSLDNTIPFEEVHGAADRKLQTAALVNTSDDTLHTIKKFYTTETDIHVHARDVDIQEKINRDKCKKSHGKKPFATRIATDSQMTAHKETGVTCLSSSSIPIANASSWSLSSTSQLDSTLNAISQSSLTFSIINQLSSLPSSSTDTSRYISTRDSSKTPFKVKKRFDNKGNRRRRKTIIMLVLTSVFVVTFLTYIVISIMIANSHSPLKSTSYSEKAVFFFFWRLYFINAVINPFLYGFMDPRFRLGMIHLFRRNRS